MSYKAYNKFGNNDIIDFKVKVNVIREYRLKRGYTLEKLAEACDISWRNLQRIENGKYNVAKFETIKKILNILEFSNNDILKFMKDYK